jgi:phage shock protein PspC (stress-responsive transcriptional regulator)
MNDEVVRKSTEDKIIAGEAGGIGRYFNIDPILIRLAFVIATLIGGLGLFAYFILFILLPEDTAGAKSIENISRRELFASGVIILGFLLLIDNFLHFDFRRFIAPMLLIGLGIFFTLRKKR